MMKVNVLFKEKIPEIFLALKRKKRKGKMALDELIREVNGDYSLITNKVKELESAGFLVIKETKTSPSKKVIMLTVKGETIAELIAELMNKRGKKKSYTNIKVHGDPDPFP